MLGFVGMWLKMWEFGLKTNPTYGVLGFMGVPMICNICPLT